MRWRRPLLTVTFAGSADTPEAFVYGIAVRNDGERIVRDVQGQALVDGKPLAGIALVGSWTIAPNQAGKGDFGIPRDVLGDPPDLTRLAARVSYLRWFGRKHKDVRFGERSATLR